MTYAATRVLSLLSRPSIRSAKDLANFSTPSRSSVCDDVVVRDARGLELRRGCGSPRRRPRASVSPRMSPWSTTASTSVARHRVDRVGPDELLDVDRVLVVRVLGRRSTPTGSAAWSRPWPPAPPTPASRRPRGRSGRRAWRWRSPSLPLSSSWPPMLVEALVGLGVDARDEERGDRRELAARVAAAVDEALDAADVGLGDLAVALEREDQRDVDRDALGDRVLDRLQALERRRDLDAGRFGRSTSSCSRTASDLVASVSCARFGSTSSETQPSLPLPSSQTGRRMSQASRMSSLASCQKISLGSS